MPSATPSDAANKTIAAFGWPASSAIKDIEAALKAAFDYDKINYLMLMMVDPNVHYHVIPRYAAARSFNGAENADSGWPGPPALGDGITLDTGGMMAMAEHLKAHWPV